MGKIFTDNLIVGERGKPATIGEGLEYAHYYAAKGKGLETLSAMFMAEEHADEKIPSDSFVKVIKRYEEAVEAGASKKDIEYYLLKPFLNLGWKKFRGCSTIGTMLAFDRDQDNLPGRRTLSSYLGDPIIY